MPFPLYVITFILCLKSDIFFFLKLVNNSKAQKSLWSHMIVKLWLCLLLTKVLKSDEGKGKEKKKELNNSVGKYQCKSDLILQGILVIKLKCQSLNDISLFSKISSFWPGHWDTVPEERQIQIREWGIWKANGKVVTES